MIGTETEQDSQTSPDATNDAGRADPTRGVWKSPIVTLLKWTCFLAVLYLAGTSIVGRISEVQWGEIAFSPVPLGLSCLLCLAALSLTAPAYRTLLGAFCRPPRWLAMIPIAYLPPIGKYVPGKVASLAGAVWLLRKSNVPGPVAASVVFVMNALIILLCMVISAPLTLWQPVRDVLPQAWVWCLVLVIAGVVCLHPAVWSALINFVLRKLGRPPVEHRVGVRDYLKPLVVLTIQAALFGLAMWCLVRSLVAVPFSDVFVITAAICLANCMGLLAIFAPAGLGVREGILLVILTPLAGGGIAAIVAVVFRCIFTMAEALLAASGLAVLHRLQVDSPAGPARVSA